MIKHEQTFACRLLRATRSMISDSLASGAASPAMMSRRLESSFFGAASHLRSRQFRTHGVRAATAALLITDQLDRVKLHAECLTPFRLIQTIGQVARTRASSVFSATSTLTLISEVVIT